MLLEGDAQQHKKISSIQLMIAKEIVNRFALENESFDEVWEEVSTSVRQSQSASSDGYGAMPFVMSSY